MIKPKYNILKKAGSSLGFKHSAETLTKLKQREISDVTKTNLSLAASNRILSTQEKENLSKARLGKRIPLKTRQKIAYTASKLRGVPVQVKDIELNTIQDYATLSEAAKALNVSRPAIKKAVVTNKILKGK